MKFYIATGLANHKTHNKLRDLLVKNGHTITYDWTAHGPVHNQGIHVCSLTAHAELRGVIDADTVYVICPGGRGTHIEMGAALALNKRIFLISTDDTDFRSVKGTCAFYHHSSVTKVRSILELPIINLHPDK